MPEVHQEAIVDAPIETVWGFVKDMGNWASQMPGYQKFEVVNEDDSIWTVKADLGPFSRAVVMNVHVSQWNEPTDVTFELKGKSDPIKGGGAYHAQSQDSQTAIALDLVVEGSGPMAGMISAMAGPVLQRMGTEFAANLKQAIEAHAAAHG